MSNRWTYSNGCYFKGERLGAFSTDLEVGGAQAFTGCDQQKPAAENELHASADFTLEPSLEPSESKAT